MAATARFVILVVEDEPLQRIGIAEELRNHGFEVIEASRADEAVTVLRHLPVDLVLTDVEMPGRLDGLDLVRWIRTHHPHLKVAVASGSAEALAEARLLCAPNLVFAKPLAPTEVARAIWKALGNGRPLSDAGAA